MLTPLGELVVDRCRHELETGKAIRWQKLLEPLAANVHQAPGELFRQFGRWCDGAIFWSTFASAYARTREGQQQAKKRAESTKRFRAFVSGKAAQPEGPEGAS